ncbi:MAG: hypothetical protein LCH36_12270 [Actinobacteria bacterium]|jgi:hypothetical protein|nr:hypothetical protein [Actinomycetota bacterium]
MTQEEQRETLVSQSVHSALLEDLTVSTAFREDSDKYVAGAIDADELVELTRTQLGLASSR